MTTFDEREAGFEAKFTHDADVEFRIVARANKLLGRWAAAQLGLVGDAVEDYAREVVHTEFTAPGHEDVIGKVTTDLAAHSLTSADVTKAHAAAMAEARQQIMDAA